MKIVRTIFSVLIAVSALQAAQAADDNDRRIDFFETRIRPVFVKHCYRCHSEASGKQKGGLRLDSRTGWQTGGDSGPAIIPGRPDESLVLLAISASGDVSEMPPTSRLPDSVVSDFRKWIADGPVDPRDGKAVQPAREAIDIEAGRQFWAFRPVRPPVEPRSIDDLIQPAAPRASVDTLVRRLFLDLIGLPPTPEEQRHFRTLWDQSADAAVARTVDDLLARPEFGEKWARHWLDIARYADSNGGDFNLTFHQAWRYRNFVIDALNDDMPYDQFLREQIAGDLLPFDSAAQRNRQLIATGFLMVGPKMLTERNKPKMHLDIADEQLDTIGRATMGLTLGCARCHDHKFDPIPTTDYYAMAGILHSTRTADRVLMNNVNVTGWTETDLVPDTEYFQRIAARQARIDRLKADIETLKKHLPAEAAAGIGIVVDDIQATRTGPWRKSTLRPNRIGPHYLATDPGNGPCTISWQTPIERPGEYELRVSYGGGPGLAKSARYRIFHADGETQLTIDQTVRPEIDGLWHVVGRFRFDRSARVELTDKDSRGHVIADAIQLVAVDSLSREKESHAAVATTRLNALKAELKKLQDNAPEVPKAMAAQDNSGERMGDLQVRIRGETFNFGPVAPRGFLRVVGLPGTASPAIPTGQSGRVQLAEWLTHPQHPLTARVMVNRVWFHLLGRGIVPTVDNFGSRGARPSHPELLDQLAASFVSEGWSVKALIRRIVNSRTYQQSADIAGAQDPENRLFRRQNRRPAPADTMRDSMLAIAGLLERGRKQSPVAALDMYAISTSGSRHPSLAKTDELRQRSIYLPVVRGAVPPSLEIFDFPNPDLVTGQRPNTSVPAQALFMMNSPFVRSMAEAVSKDVCRANRSVDEIVQTLYRRILIRDVDAEEKEMARAYITQRKNAGRSQTEVVAEFVRILFSSAEFRFIN